MVYDDLVDELNDCRCPKCGKVGTVGLFVTQFRFQCSVCGASDINPFELGPWDALEPVADTFNGKDVSLYHVEPLEDVEPLEVNENWLDFFKYLREKEQSLTS